MAKRLIAELIIKGALREIPEEEVVIERIQEGAELYDCLSYTYEIESNVDGMYNFEDLTVPENVFLNNGAQVVNWGYTRPLQGDSSASEVTNQGVIMLPPGGKVQFGTENNPLPMDAVLFNLLACVGNKIKWMLYLVSGGSDTGEVEGTGEWERARLSIGFGGNKGYIIFEALSSNPRNIYLDGLNFITRY